MDGNSSAARNETVLGLILEAILGEAQLLPLRDEDALNYIIYNLG